MQKYKVSFLQLFGAVGISDYSWSVTVDADSEEQAIETALPYAVEMSRTTGMPPSWIRVDEESLRRDAVVSQVSQS